MTMSCSSNLNSLTTPKSSHRHDSGYFSSPSPSSSPIREHQRRFRSTIDYDQYVTKRKYVDILSELDQRHTFHLTEKIFFNLSSTDFHACLKVSREWNRICKDFQSRHPTRQVKRNLFNDEREKKIQPLNSTPMQNVTNLLEIRQQTIETHSTPEKNVHLAASSMTCRYKYLKYLHGPTIPKRCPICAYVSIVDVNDQHGICTNPLCGNSFCQCCSGPYHPPSSPCKTSTGPIKSPWRQRPTLSPIFSNKTRTNLRRLLIR